MSVDRQRITAVKAMEALGYSFNGVEWLGSGDAVPSVLDEADAMHSLLLLRADKLAGSTEASEEQTELKFISDTAEAYEAKRWPGGKIPGGKG